MTYDNNNIFAKILRGEAECIKVLENSKILAFMDVMPQAPGHTLIIPKYETSDLLNLPEKYMQPMLKATQEIAIAVKKVYDPTGVMIMQLNGADAGQTVFHLHFHVIQRSKGLEYKFHAREIESMDKLKSEAEKIRIALKN
ncbi:MAG: HIT family protein [Pseudomonadota bacterium]|nr:HIT family protein [Pseudomonadota bacterium]MEC7830217.1 HIT family protein [Pseudomonadota bacterium]MEC9382734.1 HIT family protein [Pseudomonadota bacterium]